MWLQSENYWNGLSSQDEFKAWLNQELGELYHVAEQFDAQAIKDKLKGILPEYALQDVEAVL